MEKTNNIMNKKTNILVVDDEKILRDGCIRILTKEGWYVKTAESGDEGLELFKKEHFDITLLDLKMPGMTGMELLKEIKNIKKETIVIVITGYATVDTAVEAMKAGAYDFIPKPFSPDQLRIVVNRALEKINLTRETEKLKKEKEKDLREIAGEKTKTKTIIDSMAEGVLVTDNTGKIVLYNPAATRLLNIKNGVMNQPIEDIVNNKVLLDLISNILNSNDLSYKSISKDFTSINSIDLRANVSPIIDEDNELLGSVTVLQDISKFKMLDKMKNDFVAMVSHEIRVPLAAIEQQILALLSNAVGELNNQQREMLERSKERIEALLQLISDLLDISKIESGLITQHKEPVQIIEILEKVIELFKPYAENKNITLSLKKINLPLINVDKNSMEEVFSNLISNAIKYTPQNGRVEIVPEIEGEYVKIKIIDNGIGISPDDLPRIFDKFYRVKNPQTRKITGTGLGLPIVKGLVESQLGYIDVKSELGKGSCFSVFLPI